MESNTTANNKRIAKNTAFLYLRMLFTTILSLYTARLVLKLLGVEDFGIYNVVGGVVTFMGFLTATMSSATQRYLTYHLGIGDSIRFKQTFSLLINIYLIFCIFALLVLEVVGPIYISYYMTIPQERVVAAQWVFHFSLITFIINTLSVPFRSSIIAYEKMGAYAYFGIIEAILYLSVVLFLQIIKVDQLVAYGLLILIVNTLIIAIMVLYCYKKMEDCRYISYWNSRYVKELIAYSGWNLFGSTTGVMNLQGQAIVLNYFFGPIINAAKAIADKVNGLINQFSQNFYMAVAPQIIKSYAIKDIDYMRTLVLNSSRYSFLMLFVISVPLFMIMEPLLTFWLGKEQISYEMVKFCQYTIVYSLVNILEQPITMAVRATGNIKKYQVMVGLLTLSFIPLCVFIFIMGAPAYMSMILLSIVYFVALLIRIHIVSPIIQISEMHYFTSVLLPVFLILIESLSFFIVVSHIQRFEDCDWVIKGIISLIVALTVTFISGLNKSERKLLWDYLTKKLNIKL